MSADGDRVTRGYSEELIYTSSEDGLLLEGAVIRPTGGTVQPVSVVWIHGNAARFYDYPYVAIGRVLARAGYIFISGNTRGHDIGAFLWRSSGEKPVAWRGPESLPIGGGSGWERLEEAPRDLAAWVELAGGVGSGRVVLAGHSAGAQRVVLYQAERQDNRVAGIVLASPDLRGFMPPGELERAEQMVAEGRGMEVLPAQPYAPWYRQSAQSVVSRAAVVSRLLESESKPPLIASIGEPVLAVFGSWEPGGEEMLERVRRQAAGTTRVETQVIEDADHVYSGREEEVARVIDRWASSVG